MNVVGLLGTVSFSSWAFRKYANLVYSCQSMWFPNNNEKQLYLDIRATRLVTCNNVAQRLEIEAYVLLDIHFLSIDNTLHKNRCITAVNRSMKNLFFENRTHQHDIMHCQ